MTDLCANAYGTDRGSGRGVGTGAGSHGPVERQQSEGMCIDYAVTRQQSEDRQGLFLDVEAGYVMRNT